MRCWSNMNNICYMSRWFLQYAPMRLLQISNVVHLSMVQHRDKSDIQLDLITHWRMSYISNICDFANILSVIKLDYGYDEYWLITDDTLPRGTAKNASHNEENVVMSVTDNKTLDYEYTDHQQYQQHHYHYHLLSYWVFQYLENQC